MRSPTKGKEDGVEMKELFRLFVPLCDLMLQSVPAID